MGGTCLATCELTLDEQSSYSARSPDHPTDLVTFEAPTEVSDGGQEDSAYYSRRCPLQTIGDTVDIRPPCNGRDQHTRIGRLETAPEDGGNEILSVKTVESEGSLVDRDRLLSISSIPVNVVVHHVPLNNKDIHPFSIAFQSPTPS